MRKYDERFDGPEAAGQRGSDRRAVTVAGTRVRRWQRDHPARCYLVPEVPSVPRRWWNPLREFAHNLATFRAQIEIAIPRTPSFSQPAGFVLARYPPSLRPLCLSLSFYLRSTISSRWLFPGLRLHVTDKRITTRSARKSNSIVPLHPIPFAFRWNARSFDLSAQRAQKIRVLPVERSTSVFPFFPFTRRIA